LGGTGSQGQYVVPEPGAEDEYPPLRAVPTSEQKPAGFEVDVKFRGKARYAQLTFGSAGSKPVTLAIDEVSPTEIDLYADLLRSSSIGKDDKLETVKGFWRFALEAHVVKGKDALGEKRSVVVKYQRFTRSLAIATRGYIEGTLELDGKKTR